MRQAPRLIALLVPALFVMTGCGGRRTAADVPEDRTLAQATASGEQSLEFGRPKQAVSQYRDAYSQALRRDDVQAIGDAGYNLAVAQLADHDAAAALRTASRTRDTLAARALPTFAELDLVESAALHRLGRDSEADALAARAQATAADPATIARASYIRGLISDARGDAAGISNALAWFGRLKSASLGWDADRDDLTARLDLLDGRYREAAAHAERAADIHRTQLDYRAMADTLVLAAEAMQRAGSPQDAAGLYLQAGASAAARGDVASARHWLAQAMKPGINPATRRAAQDTLATLPKAPSR